MCRVHCLCGLSQLSSLFSIYTQAVMDMGMGGTIPKLMY